MGRRQNDAPRAGRWQPGFPPCATGPFPARVRNSPSPRPESSSKIGTVRPRMRMATWRAAGFASAALPMG